jgi:hypothetical protein
VRIVSASLDIFHCPLSHPCLDKLKVLVPYLSNMKSLAKHIWVSFPNCANKRSKSPDFVHFDMSVDMLKLQRHS